MSTSYTPSTSTFHSTITVPSDGDRVNAANANAPSTQIADNAAYLNTQIAPLFSGGSFSPTGSLSFILGSGHFFSVNSSLGVSSTADGGKVSISGSNGCEIAFSLTVDHSITTAALTTGTLTTTGLVNLTDGVEITGGILAVETSATINGPLTVNGRFSGDDRILCNAGIRFRAIDMGTLSTNQTKSIDNADVFLISDSTVSSLNFKVIDPTITTPEDGITLWIVCHSTNNIVVQNASGTGLITLTNASGSPYAVQVTRIGGAYVLTQTSVKA